MPAYIASYDKHWLRRCCSCGCVDCVAYVSYCVGLARSLFITFYDKHWLCSCFWEDV